MEHVCRVRTRFNETDAHGHINNVSYFIYLEQARVEFLEDTNFFEIKGNWLLPVASVRCDYKEELFANEKITITTNVSKIGNTSIALTHNIIREKDSSIVAVGEVVLVNMDINTKKPDPLTEQLVNVLSEYTV